MADFGDLNQFLDDVDVRFEFAGKQYEVTFPFARVAAFKAHQADYDKRLKAGEVDAVERRAATYIAVAVLLGGEFDTDEWRFKKLPKAHFVNQMIADGASYTVIDRVISGIWAQQQWGDDVAVSFVKTYDLGKALAAVMKQNEESAAQETPQDTGETSEDASETPQD